MRPSTGTQIRWGLGVAGAAFFFIAVLALAPDPLFQQRVIVTTFDDVAAVSPGAQVYFRGAAVGAVRSVSLDPDTRTFAVKLGVRRAWRPSACSFAQINETNPLTPPQIELIALDAEPAACPLARAAADCIAVPAALLATRGERLIGCRRAPDFFQTAAAAVAQITEVAKSANIVAGRLQALVPSGGSGVDLKQLVSNATTTLAATNQLTQRLDATLAPGKGDAALTLANLRRASDHAASIDVASLNASLVQMKQLIAQNQQTVSALLSQGKDMTTDGKALLENLSSSLTASGNSLQRTTDNLDALTERLSADPAYLLHGQRFTDPPPPKSAP